MTTLIVATHNRHKTQELQQMANDLVIKDLHDIGQTVEIDETGTTLEENALLKAQYVYNKYGISCLADDTGLEIDCLHGAPGVFSARYAGEEKDPKKNMEKVLQRMKGCTNRKARFRTVIALVLDGKPHLFEGIVDGYILEAPCGNEGFGYDPIFRAEGTEISFAQMPLNQKNKISHRARAFEKFVQFLKNQTKNE